MCTHVYRHCAGTASGEEKSGLIQRRNDSAMTAQIRSLRSFFAAYVAKSSLMAKRIWMNS